MDWTLERVNVPNEFIVLNKNLRSYPCGRGPANFLVCPSLVVSRRHCLFVRTEDGISVIDLGSSNGVYVDGQLSETQNLVELKEGNEIGIGSSERFRDNEPMFVYKLHKGNLGSRNLEDFDTLLTQKSTTLKRTLPQNKDEEPHLPLKICKIKNELENGQTSSASLLPGPSASGSDEIEEIWSNFSGQIGVQTEKEEIVVERETAVSVRSDGTTTNVNETEKASKTVDLRNGEMEITSPRRSKSSVENNRKSSTEIDSPVSPRAPVMDNSHKTIRLSITTPSATRLTFDFTESNVEHSSATEREKKEDRDRARKAERTRSKKRETEKKTEDFETKTRKEVVETKKEDAVETTKKQDVVEEKRFDPKSSTENKKKDSVEGNKCSLNSFVVEEKRLDPKSSTETKKKDSVEGKTCGLNSFMEKKTESRLSFLNKDPVATSSPFKIKQVKQEPMTSFTLFDTVDLSDDDDYVFPSSQLFDTNVEEKPVKQEIDGSSSPQENGSDEDDKDMFAGPDGMIDDSQEIITLSDSEDEDNPWLQRLSLSQRLKEEALDVPESPASPEMEFVDEVIAPAWTVPPEPTEPEPPKELPKKPSPVVSPSTSRRRSMTQEDIEKDVNASELSDSDEELNRIFRITTDKKTQQKGPKLIEPLRLPQKKRHSLKDSLSDPDSSAAQKPSTSRIRVRDCSVEIPKLPSNMTAKQKRELQLEDRIKQKIYEVEQKNRRTKNKWAQNVQLPLGKRRSLPLSKSQKLEIAHERKEKLKRLAEKQKENTVKQPVERVAAKPKAKVSTKNRGDFLIADELRTEKDKTRVNPDPAMPSTSRRSEEKSSKSSSSSSKRHKEKEKGKRTSSRSPSRNKNEKVTSKHKSLSEHHRREKSVEKRSDELSKSLKKVAIDSPKIVEALPAVQEKKGKKKKRVRFCENLVTVREFEILPNNTMRKCVGKDASIPSDKIRRNKKVDVPQHPKLEEFLMDICKWNPSWLKEQKRLKDDPPVVEEDSLVPLQTNYKSYENYYQTLKPLLLLELWHGLTKEFEGIDKNYRRQVMFCSIVNNSVTIQPIPSTNMHLTTMLLEALASEEDIRLQRHPTYGDLIFLELQYREEGKGLKVHHVFAYVTQLHPTTITQHTFFNRDLMCSTPNATKVLTYSILTKPLQLKLCINRVIRMRCVMYLRAEMRMVRALQWLPNSPLADLIINPKVEQYHLALPPKHEQSHLVTGDKLNHRQVDAVFRVTEAVVKKEPKLCLVQGPPGTGKSEVIVNMVMQILYGDNRYRSRESGFRILLCAPSNAAIDEIVLRLLDRRAKLPSDRFKMLRVGLAGSMHPTVKDISIEELAKRDVKRKIASYQSGRGSRDELQEQKRMLEAEINKLTLELSSTSEKDEKKQESRRMKLSDARVKYDLINNCTQSATPTIDPREMMKLQKAAENQLLAGADIIACTLSSCYTNMMESAFGNTLNKISVCIVDEATQSCEAETLIPLMLGVNTLVLVGDPAQLPATVISQRAKRLGLDQSLFSRTQRAFESHSNSPVMMLDLQYRMNAAILAWPNKFFYDQRLRNGLVGVKPPLPLQPYRVVDLDSCQNADKFSNTREAEFVANLTLGLLYHLESKCIGQISIGVITPYRNQQAIVQAKMNERFASSLIRGRKQVRQTAYLLSVGHKMIKFVDSRILPVLENLKISVNMAINTVDSFQGHERDVIIMSCVRSSGIGFLADRQRLCVALTRAKHCLVLCGNFATFQRNMMWRGLLTDAQSRKNYLKMKSDATPGDIASLLVK